MKYFAIFEKNVERIFQLKWKIGNISDMFLQYSMLCGIAVYAMQTLINYYIFVFIVNFVNKHV